MWHTKPISLTLVFLLAFWTPVVVCCGAVSAEGDECGSSAQAAAPSCHDLPEGPLSDDQPLPEPCEDHECTCTSPMLSACQEQPVETKVVPSSSSHLLGSLLALAPLQPQTMLPHTFFTRHGELEDAAPPLRPALTLLALSCQLTL